MNNKFKEMIKNVDEMANTLEDEMIELINKGLTFSKQDARDIVAPLSLLHVAEIQIMESQKRYEKAQKIIGGGGSH